MTLAGSDLQLAFKVFCNVILSEYNLFSFSLLSRSFVLSTVHLSQLCTSNRQVIYENKNKVVEV